MRRRVQGFTHGHPARRALVVALTLLVLFALLGMHARASPGVSGGHDAASSHAAQMLDPCPGDADDQSTTCVPGPLTSKAATPRRS